MPEVETTPTGYPRKRAQTRQRLLRAGLEALGDAGPNGLTVSQLTTLAGTSQGTFYNHFSSIAELVAEAADHLGQGVEIATDALEAVEHDPAARVAIGTLQLLRLADDDRMASAAFVTLTAVLPDFRTRVRSVIRRAIEDGVRAGRFTIEPGEAPVNAVLGASLQSMRSRNLGESGSSEHGAVAALILRALGLAPYEIPAVVERAAQIVASDPWRPLAA